MSVCAGICLELAAKPVYFSTMKKSFVLFAVLMAMAAIPANAASTYWHDLGGGEVRMSADMDPATGIVSGLVEIRLKPGWKTYWREPGGSGIPPVFDFTSSENFDIGEVLFPAPAVLKSGTSIFAGYKGMAAFPFSGKRADLPSGGALRLELLAGVCDEICIPAQASLEIPAIDLNRSDPKVQTLIAMARLGLPTEPTAQLNVESAVVSGTALSVSVVAPDSQDISLFVEGATGWYLTVPEMADRAASRAVFTVEIAGQPKGVTAQGQDFRFTLVSGSKAVEQTLTVK